LNNSAFQTDIAPDRRDNHQPPERALGRVIACDGSRATILSAVSTGNWQASDAWAIGRMVSINLGASRIVALVYKLHAVEAAWSEAEENPIRVEVEFLGEVLEGAAGERPRFQSGITTFPPIGAVSHRIRAGDLALVHDLGERAGVEIGYVTQDASIPATVSIQDMLSRHFALVGTTGVGKSSAVSLLLRRAVSVRPRLRVLILDPHNEYSSAFPDLALTIDGDSLDLPFWMFSLEELTDVVFRGRPAPDDEADILREVVIAARARYRQPKAQELARDLGSSLLKRPLDLGASRQPSDAAPTGGGLELATPYRLKDAFAVIDELIGLHEQRWPRGALRSLKVRLEALHNDPRYRFMFGRANMYETVAPILAQVFRFPMHGRPITAFQLGGLPGEVVNAVASVLSRLAFDLAAASQGTCEILVLCEEAHRYVPSDPSLGFAPTRQALARIAKEGRKYGSYLGIVTQRPGELDPTILSQCSTVFAMRLANERDQQIIRSAISDASASTINFLSSIGNREAIAFGEGVATTMRMRFAEIRRQELPAMGGRVSEQAEQTREPTLDDMVRRMRA
jgi:DNA helicase HerA-like ATPase